MPPYRKRRTSITTPGTIARAMCTLLIMTSEGCCEAVESAMEGIHFWVCITTRRYFLLLSDSGAGYVGITRLARGSRLIHLTCADKIRAQDGYEPDGMFVMSHNLMMNQRRLQNIGVLLQYFYEKACLNLLLAPLHNYFLLRIPSLYLHDKIFVGWWVG